MNDLIFPNNMSHQNQIGSYGILENSNSRYEKAQLPTANEYQYTQSLEIMCDFTKNQQKEVTK